MIKKEELIKYFEENLSIEEKALPIYSQHLNNTVFLSGFSKQDQERLKQTLIQLRKESEVHGKIYQALIKRVKESAKDVY